MSARLAQGGRRIDRTRVLKFRFNGQWMRGFEGDTLASALLANDQILVGRSFKYHRPRGIVASGAEEPNALVGLGKGARFEPNQRATTTELFDRAEITSQNHWPSLAFDVGAINAALSRFFPAGFYYKTFMHPRPFWKHVFEPVIRHAAGLGRAPDAETRDADSYSHAYAFCDVLIAGGGIAGLQAALAAGRAGARVMLLEASAHWGGRAPVDDAVIDGQAAGVWVDAALAELSALPNVTLRLRTMVAGVYDHGYVLAVERRADHSPEAGQARQRLWRCRTGRLVVATGAIERPLSFAGNDKPGVMLASAVRDYVIDYGVSPGASTVIVTNNDDAYRTAIALHKAGQKVPAILDTRSQGGGELMDASKALGLRVLTGAGVAAVRGLSSVISARICDAKGTGAVTEEIHCDVIAMSGGWSPVVNLWSHTGGKLIWDEAEAFFRPDASRAPIGADGEVNAIVAGTANGHLDARAVLRDAHAAGARAAAEMGATGSPGDAAQTDEAATLPIEPIWVMPEHASDAKRAKMFLDFQNDVKVADVQLAAREGFESVEHTKRYTTLGMATDQGKLSNINGLAVLSDALDQPIPQTGTTTFRPPYAPVTMGTIAGEARSDTFQPLRRTPIHTRHQEAGAHWEPVGHWRRPYCFPRAGESIEEAVAREITTTRTSVGMLDASTLGKIIVKGPDAGRFMDMMYTNMMSSLGVGRCRYGLMCSENGFLIDDGVVVKLADGTYLAHTTTGGADRIHAHMEEWLQTEWWDWQVYTANVTEAFAQIAVVGPKARAVLEKLGGMDLSADALPFMRYAEGKLGGFDARVFRISFSGELSYEVAVPAAQGLGFWDAVARAGAEFGITPYGTEALHVMRAEKGFIMIGDETDGTVIPQDLGLHWAISKKKEDFLGKRAQSRSHMSDPNRWQLVGLETVDGSVLPDGSYAVEDGVNANGQGLVQGRVTSTYHSPTIGRGIAMGLLRHGPNRMGETVPFNRVDGSHVLAKVVSPVFYDPEGEKQNV
ncbi:MAG: sarcosine oxidase subunit alpha family protein [Pseudomonadota bacterium]